MPQTQIDFSDYHRTVIAYHGTTVAAAERLVAGEDFQPSDEDDEWFGKGIYFWEHAFQQAWRWARRKSKSEPAVVGAVIRLGYCFDLLDTGFDFRGSVRMMNPLLARITIDPAICHGKPCIRGRRYPVESMLR